LNVLMAYNNNNNIDKNPAISDLKDPGWAALILTKKDAMTLHPWTIRPWKNWMTRPWDVASLGRFVPGRFVTLCPHFSGRTIHPWGDETP
jgi:hypothetical protein